MSEKNYFVDSGSAVGNNIVMPLMNGEEAWGQVYRQINAASKSIHLCFWGLEHGLELIRNSNEILTSPDVRKQNSLYGILQQKKRAGVKIRILLWEYPLNASVNFADVLIRLSGMIGDLEVLYQPHPTEFIGSWHQKTIVIDDNIAFVSGMNAKENDWDTSEHLVFDGRRAGYNLDAACPKKNQCASRS